MKLPLIAQSQLDVRPIDWTGLTKRYFNPGELEVLVALMRSVNPRRVMEIGCNEGRTAKAILRELPGIQEYLGVDVPPGYHFAKKVQANEVPVKPGHMAADDPRFTLWLSRRGSMDLVPAMMEPLDAVFIDGDHGRSAVLHDTLLARRLVKPGGIIIWHDYHDLGTVDVRDVLDEMVATEAEPMLHVADTWIAFQRVPQ